MPNYPRARAMLLLTLASLLWGSSWLVASLLGSVASPFAAAALVFAVAAVTLSFSRQTQDAVPLRTTFLLALTMLAAPSALLVLAAGHGIGGWGPMLYALLPLMLGMVEGAWSPAMILAVGAAFLLLEGALPMHTSRLPWIFLALGAVLVQGWAVRFAARALQGCSLRQLAASLALQSLLAAACLFICSLLFDPGPRLAPSAAWGLPSVAALLLLSALATAAAYACFYGAIAGGALRPHQAAVSQWLQLLVVLAEGACFGKVLPPWPTLLGAAVLTGCAWSVLSQVTPYPVTLRSTRSD